jgi:hypothetical protein
VSVISWTAGRLSNTTVAWEAVVAAARRPAASAVAAVRVKSLLDVANTFVPLL